MDEYDREILNNIYSRRGLDTPKERLEFLRNRTGYKEYHCEGEERMTPEELRDAELSALEHAFAFDIG